MADNVAYGYGVRWSIGGTKPPLYMLSTFLTFHEAVMFADKSTFAEVFTIAEGEWQQPALAMSVDREWLVEKESIMADKFHEGSYIEAESGEDALLEDLLGDDMPADDVTAALLGDDPPAKSKTSKSKGAKKMAKDKAKLKMKHKGNGKDKKAAKPKKERAQRAGSFDDGQTIKVIKERSSRPDTVAEKIWNCVKSGRSVKDFSKALAKVLPNQNPQSALKWLSRVGNIKVR